MPKRKLALADRADGELIDAMQELADEQDDLNAQLRESKKEEEEVEAELIRRFIERKVEGGRGLLCSVTIDRKIVPKMEDYDVFIAAVKRRGDFHMLERRIAVLAWREWADHNRGKPYPGTSSHERVTLHRAKLSKRSS